MAQMGLGSAPNPESETHAKEGRSLPLLGL